MFPSLLFKVSNIITIGYGVELKYGGRGKEARQKMEKNIRKEEKIQRIREK